jgi:hypothetical protein
VGGIGYNLPVTPDVSSSLRSVVSAFRLGNNFTRLLDAALAPNLASPGSPAVGDYFPPGPGLDVERYLRPAWNCRRKMLLNDPVVGWKLVRYLEYPADGGVTHLQATAGGSCAEPFGTAPSAFINFSRAGYAIDSVSQRLFRRPPFVDAGHELAHVAQGRLDPEGSLSLLTTPHTWMTNLLEFEVIENVDNGLLANLAQTRGLPMRIRATHLVPGNLAPEAYIWPGGALKGRRLPVIRSGRLTICAADRRLADAALGAYADARAGGVATDREVVVVQGVLSQVVGHEVSVRLKDFRSGPCTTAEADKLLRHDLRSALEALDEETRAAHHFGPAAPVRDERSTYGLSDRAFYARGWLDSGERYARILFRQDLAAIDAHPFRGRIAFRADPDAPHAAHIVRVGTRPEPGNVEIVINPYVAGFTRPQSVPDPAKIARAMCDALRAALAAA